MSAALLVTAFLLLLLLATIVGARRASPPRPAAAATRTGTAPHPHQRDAQQRARPTFTAAQVAQHRTAHSLWLIIDGSVYDFTDYIDHHPGGEAIFRNAGADSSAGFHGDQHPPKVLDMLEDFYIGELAPEGVANGDTKCD